MAVALPRGGEPVRGVVGEMARWRDQQNRRQQRAQQRREVQPPFKVADTPEALLEQRDQQEREQDLDARQRDAQLAPSARSGCGHSAPAPVSRRPVTTTSAALSRSVRAARLLWLPAGPPHC
jgi:hypothetical protein